jgi:hypothetical protein
VIVAAGDLNMRFGTFGPFATGNRWNDDWHRSFWQDVESESLGLRGAIGCYMLCLKHGEKRLPCYVGKTLNQEGFYGEAFTDHKICIYEKLYSSINQSNKKSEQVILFPLLTDTGNFSQNRSSSSSTIDWLETTLIGMALSKNPDLANSQKTSLFRNVVVPGILNSPVGRPSASAQFASSVFF